MAPLLDPRFFPHIVAGILTLVDYATLLSARQVCSAMRDLADMELESGYVQVLVREGQAPEVLADYYKWVNGRPQSPKDPRVPSGSVHSSLESRARAVRNTKYMWLHQVNETTYPELRVLISNIRFTSRIDYRDDYRYPLVGIQLPAADHLGIELSTFCACKDPGISPTGCGEGVQLNASELRLVTSDYRTECEKCRENPDLRFNFDCLINANLKALRISCTYPERILSHFRHPDVLRNPNLTITIVAAPAGPEVAAAGPKFAQRFNLPEDQIHVVYDKGW
ncbi:hypothetical protein A1Q2_00434 [Trichosporon asahii var. asahii CBS 8904]|uniref:F-box domain-containing protein n=1 Tax=Trichosporon asahii var. asahii (strain CBS 8904) TaxID=1220162 RepID=K1WWX4_TRIAC|nr:hypothetical protein A1Q2_00434 [Trichosporon asahii var. asahii CBS 8904]